jgi:hypothetical protein
VVAVYYHIYHQKPQNFTYCWFLRIDDPHPISEAGWVWGWLAERLFHIQFFGFRAPNLQDNSNPVQVTPSKLTASAVLCLRP